MPVSTNRLLIELPPAVLESLGQEAERPEWRAAPAPTTDHPWDQAHRAVRDPAVVGLESVSAPAYAEPDFEQTFPFPRADGGGLESVAASPCEPGGPDDFWKVGAPAIGWHLAADHSGLGAARDTAGDPGDGRRVRVAHLDTGYDPQHATLPRFLRADLGFNFAGGPTADASDPDRHFPGTNPGHGTGTLALLAGGPYGGAPFAEVVPVRIADSVVHFATSAMAAGIDYAVRQGCQVLSVSMGGLPARAWAAAVNRAYEAGLVMFAAAGNRFGPSPPFMTVYPARFNRVVGVCGVTADGSPYFRPGIHRHMQGCFGPPAKMRTAIAACTPNMPWAVLGCEAAVGFGGGTSSATPQAAAAAALWLQAHPLPAGSQLWQRVEAVRHALFSTADRSHPQCDKFFGNGALQAAAALAVPFRGDLPPTPPDDVSFAWLRTAGVLESIPIGEAIPGTDRMYEVEALQVYLQSPAIQQLAGGADPLDDTLTPAEAKPVLAALAHSPLASAALRTHLATLVAGI